LLRLRNLDFVLLAGRTTSGKGLSFIFTSLLIRNRRKINLTPFPQTLTIAANPGSGGTYSGGEIIIVNRPVPLPSAWLLMLAGLPALGARQPALRPAFSKDTHARADALYTWEGPMYVCRLDRPWLETPFLIQGFYINGREEIEQLEKYCRFVFVDTDAPPPKPQSVGRGRRATGRHEEQALESPGRANVYEDLKEQTFELPRRANVYEDVHTIEQEIEVAKGLRGEVISAVMDIMQNVKEDKKLQMIHAKATVKKMTESILRNPDAFMWMRLLKDPGNYMYSHCMDSSALAIAFGRTLGLARHQLDDLAMGMLMCDVGMVRAPAEILEKPGRLSDEEYKIVQQHVAHGVRIMEESGRFSKASLEIAATHHEQLDGRGYPRGLRGGEVSVLGRMAAIADCFDAITSATRYRVPLSSHEAVRRLYEWRGNKFQPELIEQFIQTLGTFPIGTIVKLTTGQIGIVLAQNRTRRLRPRVLLVLDHDGKRYDSAPVVDLLKETETPEGQPMEVTSVLEAGSFGIDPVKLYL
jgi:HD-GYP domain-containing protein (c-di-GMP phosphodiesterase class II)